MRIIVKIGSNVLARADGSLSIARMAALADDVAELYGQGHQVLIVTSGAVAAGRSQINLPRTAERVARRQVLSSVGQTVLIDTYRGIFEANGLKIGQILVTKNDFGDGTHAANMRQCLQTLFAYGIVPVVNENDTVSVESLMFTDNDELAGLLAKLLEADLLIILSSVDGVYDRAPTDPEAKLLRTILPDGDDSIEVGESTSMGRGGMKTKLGVAYRTARDGITCVVANGHRPNILCNLVQDPESVPCTRFLPAAAK